jgi:hypothetical protein
MKDRIIEFLASIIAAVGVGLMMMVAFDIFWGAISLCVWLVLALFDITRNIMIAAIIGLAFTLLYIVRH